MRYRNLMLTTPRCNLVVGVALWSEAKNFWGLYYHEPTFNALSDTDKALVVVVREKLTHWARFKLPSLEDTLKPWQDEWWDHAAQLLIHRVRLSPMEAEDGSNV